MLNITPKGFSTYTGNVISIPFKDIKNEKELYNILNTNFGLSEGILILNYNTSQISYYFDEPYLVDPSRIINLDYVKKEMCVFLEVTLFDKETTISMYMHDNLKKALFSLHFLFNHRKYRFNIDDIDVNINDTFSNIINMDKINKNNFVVKVTLIE